MDKYISEHNRIFDKKYKLGILPNAENLQIPCIPKPPEKTPLLPQQTPLLPQQTPLYPQSGASDEADGLGLDLNRARQFNSAYFPTTPFSTTTCYSSSSSGKTHISSHAFEKLASTVKDNSSNLINLIIVVIILITENLVKGNLFTCPCEPPSNVFYGAAFLAAPAVALFVVGIMVNNTTWMLATGCVSKRKSFQKSILSNCHHVIGICLSAMVAPVAWIIIGFIDGQFYECARDTTPCEVTPHERNKIRAESQLIGYITMMISMIIAIIGTLLHKATKKLNYEQDRYVRVYRDVEEQEMKEAFATHARLRARQNIQEFLANDDTLNCQKAWDNISKPDSTNQGWTTPSGGSAARSNLDKHMTNYRKESSIEEDETSMKMKRDNSVKM